ncbi:hypothetical protein TrVFT333_000910 [Trichoderma virens FT-333]|nr:hypothetical protein TrVFT333_000910 [Trichoderma virens FT-333]
MFGALRQFHWREHDEPYHQIPLEEEDEKEHGPFLKQQAKLPVRLFWLRHLLTFILGLAVGLTAIIPLLVSQHAASHLRGKRLSTAIPSTVFSPKIPTSWVPDDRYVGFSEFSNAMWHRLVKTSESVWIGNPAKYGLGAGFEAQFNHSSKSQLPPKFYHISNLHQLHCLNIIRGRYFELYLDLPSLSKQSEVAAHDTAYHMDHCIEYLRMTIMCGGSWDVESSSPLARPQNCEKIHSVTLSVGEVFEIVLTGMLS